VHKVEAVVIRDRVETVIDAVERATGHVGVTVVEAIGHGPATASAGSRRCGG
jgi:nitrogen regulatory protein PII